jgi:hypothetical protein
MMPVTLSRGAAKGLFTSNEIPCSARNDMALSNHIEIRNSRGGNQCRKT